MVANAQMTPGGARIVDQVLTNAARGFTNEAHAWHHLFPVVAVSQRGGKVVEFGAEEFLEIDIERAPGEDRGRVNFGHSSQGYQLVQRALDGKVPIELVEDAVAGPGIDLQAGAVRTTMRMVSLQIEIAAAGIATKAGNYAATNKKTLAGSGQWSHADSTPAKEVEAAKEVIATGIGRDPNVLVIGGEAYRQLLNNPDVIDRIKHTEGLTGSSMPTVTASKLAQYFDVDMVVRAAARKGEKGKFVNIWGKHAVLAFSEVSGMAALGSPSYGYTYRLNGYPIARPGRFDDNCDSWLYPVTTEDTPVLVGKAAGFLFSDVVA